MFDFGRRRETMTQEPKEVNVEKPVPPPVRPGKREVELFPAIVEKNSKSLSSVTGSGSKLETRFSMFNPVSFEEALDIVESLRSRHTATICLDKMKKLDASRLIDFVAGASAALDGDFVKMTEQVIIFAPSSMKLVQDNTRQVATSGSASDVSALSSVSFDNLFPRLSAEGPDSLSSLFTRH